MPSLLVTRRTLLGASAAMLAATSARSAKSHFSDVRGQRLHWVEVGQGRPILFIHGWQLDHTLAFADFEPAFQSDPNWRRIYVDLPGAGRSPIGQVKSQDDILNVMLQFIDDVIGRSSLSLVGTSAGGYLARGIAMRKRPSVDGLLLQVPMSVPDHAKRRLPPPEDKIASATSDRARARKARLLFNPAVTRANPMLEEIEADPRRYGFILDLDGPESRLEAPVLIMAGRQDTTVGYEDVLPLLKHYPRGTLAVVAGADHSWPLDDRSLFDSLVHDWLRRVRDWSPKAAA